jgi:gamma-glutamyltranspeptidase/glutathione hydrolase
MKLRSLLLVRRASIGAFAVFFFLVAIGSGASVKTVFDGLVVSDSDLATQAGMEILKRGGNAVDAAAATAFALGVVDPASSGIGGGGFMVLYQTRERATHVLDFRETAPAASQRDLYLKGGKFVSSLSVTGALAIAVPSEVAGLAEALKRFGSLPLATVMTPAIRYASEGFPLRPHLRFAIERQLANIRKTPGLARVFLKPDGAPREEGERIVQAELGETLRAIAQQGPQVFYEGSIAHAIVEGVKKEGGVMTLDDLRNYKPVWRAPVLGRYRNRVVISMPPPSSGGVALIEMLNILEGYRLDQIQHNSTTYLHLLAEAMKHAFSDRAEYLGDPDFVQVPTQRLIGKEYATGIRGRISSVRTYGPDFYGLAQFKSERGGTTHLSVLDRFGNAVACTLTINTRFGSKVVPPGTGVILNNEIDDFSIQPGTPNVYGLIGVEANSIQPRKRPLSSMAPTIVLEQDRPVLIVGASGGPRIISAVLQTILNVLDFNLPVEKAVDAARVHHQWQPNELAVEKGIDSQTRISLERRGHAVRERNLLGVVQAILSKAGKVSGKADSRKEERAAPGPE